ncbi:uracil-DNA glycosylase [Arcobacter sp. FWKO B]|uniref:uracil-DNA glycosylase n=1 Tax=Arcobacter sp. FWKO B TaxID=2593672 RepID=UPI0018A60F8B|nr:uracil-DNA glycosylase [Arcobacter sp. FWKO B]QOG13058.1 uracil-DNA glycosylase [Arcobacter sp. FWKO B]
MTRFKSIKILQALNTLKSFGYEYHMPVVITKEIPKIKLPNKIEDLRNIVNNCSLCSLSKTKKNILFGNGDINSDIMIVTFAPTELEDSTGEFYAGNGGQLIENIVTNVLNRDKNEVFITSFLKCKPNFNDTSTEDAIEACKSYLYQQIVLIKPKIVVLFGENVYKAFLNKEDFEYIKGSIFDYNGYNILATYEHMHILKNPTLKKEVFVNMLKIKSFLE